MADKFEQGKKYKHKNDDQNIYEAVYVDEVGALLAWGSDFVGAGRCFMPHSTAHMHKEYIEPKKYWGNVYLYPRGPVIGKLFESEEEAREQGLKISEYHKTIEIEI